MFFGRQGAGLVGREGRLGHGAGEPREQRGVEAFVQRLGIQRIEQRGEQAVESARLLVRGQPVQPFGQGQRVQDVEVGAVGVRGLDVADERDAAEHVAAGIALVRAAVDDGEGQPIGVAEQHDDRHGEQAVELAGHVGQRGAGVPCAPQFDGEEQIGFEQPGFEGRVLEQRAVGLHFRVGQLKEQVGLVPLGELGLLRVQGLAGGGFGHAAECGGVGGARNGQGAVAAIAERGEQRQAGGAQPGRGERGERGGDVGEGVRGGHGQAVRFGWRLAAGDPLPRITSGAGSSPPPVVPELAEGGEGIERGRDVRMAMGRGCQRWGEEEGRSRERGRPARLGAAEDLLLKG